MLQWTRWCSYLFGILMLILWGKYSEVGLLRSYKNSILNFLRNLRTVFYSGRTILRSHWQCQGPPSSPTLLAFVFWAVVVLTGVKWHLTVVLLCIALVINEGETIRISKLQNREQTPGDEFTPGRVTGAGPSEPRLGLDRGASGRACPARPAAGWGHSMFNGHGDGPGFPFCELLCG